MDKQTQDQYNRSLQQDYIKMRNAGNELAIASLRVINDYDGIHRLAQAVSIWASVVATSGGRSYLEEGKG